MFSVCTKCGEWQPTRSLRVDGAVTSQAFLSCDTCYYEMAFAYLPLLIVTGASGTGKSTLCHAMAGNTEQLVTLDSDILWGIAYTAPDEWPQYFEMWLRLCLNIHLSGRSVLLFGAGLNPQNIESCPNRRYFSDVHYLALTCDEEILRSRLTARPAWRNSGTPKALEEQLNYNRWFLQQPIEDPPLFPAMTTLDTSNLSVAETHRAADSWWRQKRG